MASILQIQEIKPVFKWKVQELNSGQEVNFPPLTNPQIFYYQSGIRYDSRCLQVHKKRIGIVAGYSEYSFLIVE